jgi:CubicO group peptidase (beta-lactamase class C family)
MLFRSSALVFALLAATSGCSDSEAPNGPPPPSELERKLRTQIDDAVASGFSGAILLTVGGERLVAEGHGFADRDEQSENTPETAFDVGSIMKSFTATAIFGLVERGSLELSTSLADIFPETPPDKADITMLDLLTHSAGFDEYHDTEGDFEPMTRLEAREHIFAQELLFPPGSDSAYSNSGYTLLADVIESVSGEPFADHLRHAVFERAELEHTGFYSDPIWQTVETAIGYDASTFGDNDPARWPYTWALVGNGGLVTTVLDLDRWLSALWEGRVVSEATLDLMRSEYLDAVELEGEIVYAEAGAGDFGLGGVLVFAPVPDTRILIATNAYETFDIEAWALDLTLLAMEHD